MEEVQKKMCEFCTAKVILCSDVTEVNSSIFWDISPCSLLKLTLPDTCFNAGILFGLFDIEDGGDMFLRNGGLLSTGKNLLSSTPQLGQLWAQPSVL
jgi:hypothetical protein